MVVTLPHLKHRVTEEADLVRPGALGSGELGSGLQRAQRRPFRCQVSAVISAAASVNSNPPVLSVVGARSTLGSTTFKSRVL